MEVETRFPSVVKKANNDVVLFNINPSVVFWTGFLPPLAGALIAIGTALTLHQDAVTNYNWMCGRAYLPSLSRIINLDFEGIFWQLFIYFHTPLRILELFVGFYRYDRLRCSTISWPRLYTFTRYCYFLFGFLEVVFLIGLSAVGEKEHGIVHLFFFYTFGVFAFLFFVTNTICHSQSLLFLHPYGTLSYRLKVLFCGLYLVSVPLIALFYTMYWKLCITVAYELFALTEYADVMISMAYHACAFLDIRHKVIFSVTYTPRAKRKNGGLVSPEQSTPDQTVEMGEMREAVRG